MAISTVNNNYGGSLGNYDDQQRYMNDLYRKEMEHRQMMQLKNNSEEYTQVLIHKGNTETPTLNRKLLLVL